MLEKEINLQKDTDTKQSLYLVTMPIGIGDITYALAALEQIVKNDPSANGKIDVVCTNAQTEFFKIDPRVNRIIINQPNADQTLLTKIFIGEQSQQNLLKDLKKNNYKAIFPGNAAMLFDLRIGRQLMLPNINLMLQSYLALRKLKDVPVRVIVKKIINLYFAENHLEYDIDDRVDLYISEETLMKAAYQIQKIKEIAQTNPSMNRIIIVSKDTTSSFTRPPTELLNSAISKTLEQDPNLIVYILPSFTDAGASSRLYSKLAHYGKRVQLMSPNRENSLLYVTALIDQADLLITPDTGIMHLAAARKIVVEKTAQIYAKNSLPIIALFGATNPGLYGYAQRSTIIGRGRKEQTKLQPGFYKNACTPKNINYFSHIDAEELQKKIHTILT